MRRKKYSHFVMMPWDLLDSPQWAKLTCASKVAYLHLKRKVTKPHPEALSLSYDEMEKHMNRHTFARSIRQLEKAGFIVKEQSGGLFRKRNFYKFSEVWRQRSSAISGTASSGDSGIVKEAYRRLKTFDSGGSGTCLT